MKLKFTDRRIAAMLCVPLAFGAFLMVAASHRVGPEGRRGRQSIGSPKPRVVVKEQPNSPLVLSAIDTTAMTPHRDEFDAVVLNRSLKPIRAYALRYDVKCDQSNATGGLELSSKVSPDSLLEPGRSESTNIGGADRSDTINSVEVSVDFVEFADGTVWGPDTAKSGERLAGMRSGGMEAARYLHGLLKSRGQGAVMGALETETPEVSAPEGHSPEWTRGFAEGIAMAKARVRNAIKAGGAEAIEPAIRRPFDASDKQRPM
jgi:hypothetical protein